MWKKDLTEIFDVHYEDETATFARVKYTARKKMRLLGQCFQEEVHNRKEGMKGTFATRLTERLQISQSVHETFSLKKYANLEGKKA